MLEFEEYKVKLNNIRPSLDGLKDALKLEAAAKEIEELEKASEMPGFWNDVEKSQKVQKRLKNLKAKSEKYASLCSSWDDMMTICEMAIEENDELTEFVQTGIPVDGKISAELLINIFEKNTPLHDGAVIIRQGRVDSATCYLPLSKDQSISKELGTRHRAAIGLSEVSDSKIFVVSEETGQLSMAHNGHIFRNISDDFIRRELLGDTAPVKNRIAVVDKLLRRKEQ